MLLSNVAYSGKSLDSNFELYPFPLTIPIYQHGRIWSHGFRLPPYKKTGSLDFIKGDVVFNSLYKSCLLTIWNLWKYIVCTISFERLEASPWTFKATFHLTISVREKHAMGKIQRNNYHHGSCRPSLTGKTSSVSLIFTHGTHRNVKNRWVRSSPNSPSAIIAFSLLNSILMARFLRQSFAQTCLKETDNGKLHQFNYWNESTLHTWAGKRAMRRRGS